MLSPSTIAFIKAVGIVLQEKWYPTVAGLVDEDTDDPGVALAWSTKDAYADITFYDDDIICSARQRGEEPQVWETDRAGLQMSLWRMRAIFENKLN